MTNASHNNSLTLFVYGTLRYDYGSNAHQQYLQDTEFLSLAKTRGQLFMVADYPGLRLTQEEDWVTGEIYLLKDHTQLHHLDVYEGCASTSPKPHEYMRDLVEVILPDKETLNAWTYIYQNDTTQLAHIHSGDFLKQ